MIGIGETSAIFFIIGRQRGKGHVAFIVKRIDDNFRFCANFSRFEGQVDGIAGGFAACASDILLEIKILLS
jgi:hypothetical protein